MKRHSLSEFRRPISSRARQVTEEILTRKAQLEKDLVLDFCCGVAESTTVLSQRYPGSLVVGLEKSELRSCLAVRRLSSHSATALVYRVNYIDFLQCAEKSEMRCSAQFWLYPNPWPKSKHLQRRWYAHPSFCMALKLGGYLEYRTNWEIGADECVRALLVAGYPTARKEELIIAAEEAVTPFERKYLLSGHRLWRVEVDLDLEATGT